MLAVIDCVHFIQRLLLSPSISLLLGGYWWLLGLALPLTKSKNKSPALHSVCLLAIAGAVLGLLGLGPNF